MSLEATVMASKVQGIDPRDKFVLVALANFAGDDLKAWPRQQTLAEWTCYSRKTINLALTELERVGLIVSTQQYRDDGGFRSKVYDLSPLERLDRPPVTSGNRGVLPSVTPPVTRGNSKNSHKNSQEGRKHKSANADAFAEEQTSAEEEGDDFDAKQEAFRSANSAKVKASETSPEIKTILSIAKGRAPTVIVLLKTYEANRGGLPRAGATKARVRALVKFIEQCEALDYNPVDVMEKATQLKARDPFYLGKNDSKKKYGLDAMLRGDGSRAIGFYEELPSTPNPITDRFPLGARFTYAMRPVKVVGHHGGLVEVEYLDGGGRVSAKVNTLWRPEEE